jgi:ATP-dependent DNA helicase DinG
MLVLFTNAEDLRSVGQRVEGFLAERHIAFWYQRMEGSSKEELGELFRSHTDSVLFGLDTFWFGTDFPGATLEYLLLVRLPYGVPDRYHHAQCAVLGSAEQRRQVYMPRALAKFRQGFGRLMRRESDRGCVFLLDRRILDPRHRAFLRELPVKHPFADDPEEDGAELVVGDTDRCLDASLVHMGMKADVRRRGLDRRFAGWRLEEADAARPPMDAPPVIAPEDLPF